MLRLTIHPQTPILSRRLKKILRLLNLDHGSWSITLVKDAQMKTLHKKTMNLNTTTDVLTFNLADQGDPLDLDTVICIDEAKRRAEELDHPVADELLLYSVHSLLHVQGYDDTTDKKAKHMHAREDELLQAIGLGPVYAPKEPPQKQRRKAPK